MGGTEVLSTIQTVPNAIRTIIALPGWRVTDGEKMMAE